MPTGVFSSGCIGPNVSAGRGSGVTPIGDCNPSHLFICGLCKPERDQLQSAVVADSKRRHPNAADKRAMKAASLHRFVRQYGRKAVKGSDPNDRRYDRGVEKSVKRMRPEKLDRLLHDDDD